MRETTRNFKYVYVCFVIYPGIDHSILLHRYFRSVIASQFEISRRKIEAKENRKVVKYSSGSLWFFLVVYPSSPTLDRFFLSFLVSWLKLVFLERQFQALRKTVVRKVKGGEAIMIIVSRRSDHRVRKVKKRRDSYGMPRDIAIPLLLIGEGSNGISNRALTFIFGIR